MHTRQDSNQRPFVDIPAIPRFESNQSHRSTLAGSEVVEKSEWQKVRGPLPPFPWYNKISVLRSRLPHWNVPPSGLFAKRALPRSFRPGTRQFNAAHHTVQGRPPCPASTRRDRTPGTPSATNHTTKPLRHQSVSGSAPPDNLSSFTFINQTIWKSHISLFFQLHSLKHLMLLMLFVVGEQLCMLWVTFQKSTCCLLVAG